MVYFAFSLEIWRVKLISTQVLVLVEVGVELGKIKKVDEFVREITPLGWV